MIIIIEGKTYRDYANINPKRRYRSPVQLVTEHKYFDNHDK